MYPRSMFLSKNKKNNTYFASENCLFTTIKFRSILHGHICVLNGYSAEYSQFKDNKFYVNLLISSLFASAIQL